MKVISVFAGYVLMSAICMINKMWHIGATWDEFRNALELAMQEPIQVYIER